MPTKFYISDTHFSHRNIIKFESEKRPFTTIEEHDEFLIEQWNKTVSNKDHVVHLGDVIFQPEKKFHNILSRLNGIKTLVMGNHEHLNAKSYLEYFKDVKSVLENRKLKTIFSHYPLHHSQVEGKFRFNVHGHCHSFVINDPRYINISCEHTGLRPISHDELMKIIDIRKSDFKNL